VLQYVPRKVSMEGTRTVYATVISPDGGTMIDPVDGVIQLAFDLPRDPGGSKCDVPSAKKL